MNYDERTHSLIGVFPINYYTLTSLYLHKIIYLILINASNFGLSVF